MFLRLLFLILFGCLLVCGPFSTSVHGLKVHVPAAKCIEGMVTRCSLNPPPSKAMFMLVYSQTVNEINSVYVLLIN